MTSLSTSGAGLFLFLDRCFRSEVVRVDGFVFSDVPHGLRNFLFRARVCGARHWRNAALFASQGFFLLET